MKSILSVILAISTALVYADWHIYLPKNMSELYVYSENQNIPIICYSGQNSEDIVIPETVELLAISKSDQKQFKIPVDISVFKKPIAHSKNILANWVPHNELRGDFELKLSYQVKRPNNEIASHGSGSQLTVLKEGSCIQCYKEKNPNTPIISSAVGESQNGEKPADTQNGEQAVPDKNNENQEIVGAGDSSCSIHGNKDENKNCEDGKNDAKSGAASSDADFGNKNANSSSSGALSAMKASNALVFCLVILGFIIF